jgi:hypothetical protein
MIDRENRDLAAELVRQFRDGQIEPVGLDARWPSGSEDMALTGIASALWYFFDDYEPLRSAPDPAVGEEWDTLTRYAAFLDSPLSYVPLIPRKERQLDFWPFVSLEEYEGFRTRS